MRVTSRPAWKQVGGRPGKWDTRIRSCGGMTLGVSPAARRPSHFAIGRFFPESPPDPPLCCSTRGTAARDAAKLKASHAASVLQDGASLTHGVRSRVFISFRNSDLLASSSQPGRWGFANATGVAGGCPVGALLSLVCVLVTLLFHRRASAGRPLSRHRFAVGVSRPRRTRRRSHVRGGCATPSRATRCHPRRYTQHSRRQRELHRFCT